MTDPIPLAGGRLTVGVVRVGNSVRRPLNDSSEFVQALLDLFERRGFSGAPRYLGQADGIDILSYLPGDVPARFQVWEDRQVAAAGELLRAMHEASRGSGLAGRFPVVCHHDPGPNNAVFRDGLPVAWIDFDMAAPGSPMEDIGYAAWSWCISSKRPTSVDRQAEQVKILVDSYGLEGPERAVVVDSILERQARNARFWAAILAGPGVRQTSPEAIASRIEWSRREFAFTYSSRTSFEDALA
ncbi:phosphotransferase family protein [Streptacidiphilus jiangxiensis]|uniref:phosphotransferase family protein n=1 Tax=Streptacidiphilus jiangxiensis TaxID=235985 RepID=UPI0005A7FE5C|nr:aminoglycoside phosphotransferase family protein [Streptacidiphilus jiangxiensis]